MPPRARKTAATKPESAEQAPLDDQPAPEPAPAPELLPQPDPEPVTPRAPAFHWEAVAGASPEPCRLCFPSGAPAGVGSIGCQHGQWVRVQGGD